MFVIKPDISIVIPVFNSEKTLNELYRRIKIVMENLKTSYELVLVDDFSQDSSYQVIKQLRNKDPRVKIIKLAYNHGQHNATLCGLSYSQGECLITMDDDLQHPPEEIPHLLTMLENGYDAVFGVPEVKAQGVIKNAGSFMVDKTLNLVCQKPSSVKVSSFRLLKRELVEKMLVNQHEGFYMAALILENAKSPSMVRVQHDPRRFGKSNYNLMKSFKLARNLWVNHSAWARVKKKSKIIFGIEEIIL